MRVSPDTIKNIVDAITREILPEKIILFGSSAYGEPNRNSDIDLLIIWDTPLKSPERQRCISRLLTPRPAPLDIVVKTPSEIANSQDRVDPFLHEILEKGIPVYERRN